MGNSKEIGVFDSGVGGITVLKEILKKLPNEDIIYFGDNKNSPYGEKTREEILNYCIKAVNFLKSKGCKIILIACNTATAAALDTLKEKFEIPIFGVIEAGAKTAIKKVKNSNIAVLATDFTCKTEAYSKEIWSINKNIKVSNIPCKNLCPMIEAGWDNQLNKEELLFQYIKKIPKDFKVVILGCTHYPIIKKDIEKYLNNHILVDPALESVLEIEIELKKKNLLNEKKEIGSIEFFLSGDTEVFKRVTEDFLDIKIPLIKIIENNRGSL